MTRFVYWVGISLQSVTLGALLFFALLELICLATDARVFRYQNF